MWVRGSRLRPFTLGCLFETENTVYALLGGNPAGPVRAAEELVDDTRDLSTASERLDRIVAVSHLTEEVLESKEAAAQWMSKPNKVLGGEILIMLCKTEIGDKQVRRVLQALEWGGAV